MKKLQITLLLLSFTAPLWGQDTIYLDQHWHKTSKNKASYFRVFTQRDSLWLVRDYYITTHQIQMEGTLCSMDPGDKQGFFKWFDEEGRLVQTGNYSNGKKHGKLAWYYPNGNIKNEEYYINDKVEGEIVSYHPDGRLRMKTFSQNNRLHGPSEYWYANGQKEAEGMFKNGKQTGPWKFWDENGALLSEIDFQIDFQLEECGLTFEIPNNSWFFVNKETNGRYAMYAFKREPLENKQGMPVFPNISFIVEDAADMKDVLVYSSIKRSMMNFEVESSFNREDGELKLKNAIGFWGNSIYQNGTKHSICLIHVLHQGKGIQIIMDMTSDIFEEYNEEFREAVRNINVIFSSK